jgi:hypothetical protein
MINAIVTVLQYGTLIFACIGAIAIVLWLLCGILMILMVPFYGIKKVLHGAGFDKWPIRTIN